MKTKVSPTLIGLFVLGAFALALIALFAIGDVHLFNKPQRFVVYFEESIHGLDLGSPVKLQGVRVGRVVSLNVRYSSKTNQPVVAVGCELSKNVIFSDTGDRLDVAEKGQMEKLISRGMRARLGVLSLATGLLFVELDFYDPLQYPIPATSAIPAMPVSDGALLVVPAVPSAISEFQASISEILANVRKVNFAGLASDVQGLLKDTRKQINGLDLAALNGEWMKAGQSVTALASSPEIKQTFLSLNIAIEQLTRTLSKIDGQVQPTSQELAKTLSEAQQSLRAFNEAAMAARNFISAQSGLGEEAARTMSQLGDAAASVQRLADFIERNPNALLTGKKPPR